MVNVVSADIKLANVIRYWKGLPQQVEAVNWLDRSLTDEQREQFGLIFRADPAMLEVTPSAPVAAPAVNPASGEIRLELNWTGKYHASGFRIFRLALMNGDRCVDQIAALSGAGFTQREDFVHPSKDYSGSLRCLPEGIYQLGAVEDSTTQGSASWGDALGRYWSSIDAIGKSKVNSRGDFGIHLDNNASYSPGSAGCICPFDPKDILRYVQWMSAKAKPKLLHCNLGLGFLKTL